MLLPDTPILPAPRHTGIFWLRRSPGKIAHRTLGTLVPALLAAVMVTYGSGDTVKLTRKYRAGQSIVYTTRLHTNSQLSSNPPELKDSFPPMPKDLLMNQQTTVTVAKVQPNGAADVQHRFDKFDIKADLDGLPASVRDSVDQAQQEVSQEMVGKTLTAHYGPDGKLVDFEGADTLFKDIDAPVRDPLLQMLRLFLEQMGGQSLYPDHPVKEGDQWTQDLDAKPLKNYPFQVKGKSTLHYSGKTRYQGVKAAIVDYQFENTLTPQHTGMQKDGSLPQLEASGASLEVKITGKGQGRILVALDDGRVLQNHSTLHQTLVAAMRSKEGLVAPTDQLPRLEIQSDTEMNVDGNKP